MSNAVEGGLPPLASSLANWGREVLSLAFHAPVGSKVGFGTHLKHVQCEAMREKMAKCDSKLTSLRYPYTRLDDLLS